MSRSPWVQLLAAIVFLGVIVLAAALIAENWAQWVVYGVFVVTFFAFAHAVYQRQWNTKNRGVTRRVDDQQPASRGAPGPQVKREEPSRMVETIAVGTDGSDTATRAVDFAIEMAERFGSRLVVISAFVPVSEDRLRKEQDDAPADVQWTINPFEDVETTLREVEEKAAARGLQTASEARQGSPADVLCDLAEEHGADVLVVGNKGMQRRVLGSVPNSVTHKAPCSVLVVKTT
jgi:nucleotide-binding universal stress UspA family protein